MVERKHSLSEALEARARRVAAHAREDRESSPVVRGLVQEIALILDQIDGWRGTRERLDHSLLRAECYTDTELMQMEARTPKYSPYRFPEREKLQRRLFEIEKERRRFILSNEEKMQDVHQRLLSLLEKHDQLTA